MRINLWSMIACGAVASAAAAGPEWTETPDAGNLPGSAQTPIDVFMVNDLTGIKGALSGGSPRGTGDFQDMYRVLIKDPEAFSAVITQNTSGNPSFNTMLWVFDELGRGVLGNDNATFSPVMNGSGMFNNSTDGTGVVITNPGIYYIAVSGAGSVPVDSNGTPIFEFAVPDEVSGPDGSLNPIAGWSGPGAIGEYTIQFSGVSFIPSPGAAGLFGLAGLTASRRRRRA